MTPKGCHSHRSSVSIAKFGDISYITLVFLLLILNKKIPAGFIKVLINNYYFYICIILYRFMNY